MSAFIARAPFRGAFPIVLSFVKYSSLPQSYNQLSLRVLTAHRRVPPLCAGSEEEDMVNQREHMSERDFAGRHRTPPMQARRRGAVRQRGIAAVELAITMPLLIVLLVFPLYFGRVYWQYTVFQHAAQDAARYVSNAPASEMVNPNRALDVTAVASAIVAEELAEIPIGSYKIRPLVTCDGAECAGYTRPTTVKVTIQTLVEDAFFPGQTELTLPLVVNVTSPILSR
jgi:Flp pilus assembly protein TadG